MRLVRFLEVFAYFAPAHAYSLHVSFLGLFPILMSSNEALKREAVGKLEAGGLFALGVSEKAHGSDLLANEFTVREAGPSPGGGAGVLVADGWKYYIGNANAACMISVLAKKVGPEGGRGARRAPFVFFALRPGETPAFRNLRKIRTLGIRPAFVGEFEVAGHRVPEGDVMAEGRDAWDAVFNTVNFGKFFLGFGSVGICEHAFAEAAAHLRRRVLYGKPVAEMPHIRSASAVAFARLAAMKFFAYRALDYLQVAGDDDRRYLLFNAVQKARVSTEGVKVLALLSECVGARGFESETYFESALREAPMIPGLEGSTHINFGLTAQFIDPYFADPPPGGGPPPAPRSLALGGAAPDENPYWREARDRNARTVRFAPFRAAYRPLEAVPNVRPFREQVEAFRRLFAGGVAALNPNSDADLSIALGRCFAVAAYGQLVAEGAAAAGAVPEVVSVIFHALVEDLSTEALKLSVLFAPDAAPRALLKEVVSVPDASPADVAFVSGLIAAEYGR